MREWSGIGRFGNEDKGLFGVVFLVFFADLLHLKHSFHNEFVLALFVGVALVLALPRKVELGLPTLVERDEQVSALVPVSEGNPSFDHLLLCRYHLLRWSFNFHSLSLPRSPSLFQFNSTLSAMCSNPRVTLLFSYMLPLPLLKYTSNCYY